MTLAGLLLVLVAAVCHATWNIFVKRINGGPELIWLFSVVAVVIYAPMAAWVIVVEQPEFNLWQIGFVLGSVALHLGYFVLLQAGYRRGDLSLVYPTARASGPMLSTVFAVFLLGETLSLQMGVGAAIILAGVLMLTRKPKGAVHHVSASLVFGLGAGLFIGSYTAWDAYAVSVLVVPPLLMDYGSNLGRVILLTPIARRRWETVRMQWRDFRWFVIGIGVFSPLAYILVLYALTFTPVAYVAPLREVSVLLSILAGSLLLGEGQLKRRLCWGSVILVGMVVLVTS